MSNCPNGRHGYNVRQRGDGSTYCLRCGKEWPAAREDDEDLDAAPRDIMETVEVFGGVQIARLPTMAQQESTLGMPSLFDDPASDEDDYVEE